MSVKYRQQGNYAETYQHRRIAEIILGRALRGQERVHHVDGNGLNNKNSNLVICPNEEYHKLLHTRQEAYDNCGNASYRKCTLCHEYDSPVNMRRKKSGDYYHVDSPKCRTKFYERRGHRRRYAR